VTITGTGLSGATAVKFGAANAAGYTVNPSGSITATSPAGKGTVNVTVTTSEGTSATSSSDEFTYQPPGPRPTVKRILPKRGSAGTLVVIEGTGFEGEPVVRFGETEASNVKFETGDGTLITADAPAGSGAVFVTVSTANGTSALTRKARFTYRR